MNALSLLIRKLFCMTVLFLMITGCSHRQYIANNAPADKIAEVNQRLENKSAMIKTANAKIWGKNIHIAADSLHYLDESSEMGTALPRENVVSVTYQNHVRGAGEGFLVGFAGGLLVLGASVAIANNQENDGFMDYSGLGIVLAGMAGGAAICMAGTAAGANIGGKNIYILEQSEAKGPPEIIAQKEHLPAKRSEYPVMK